jgi:hypothetical protein
MVHFAAAHESGNVHVFGPERLGRRCPFLGLKRTSRLQLSKSESGTNRTNRAGLVMSVDRGRPEVTARAPNGAIDPTETLVAPNGPVPETGFEPLSMRSIEPL